MLHQGGIVTISIFQSDPGAVNKYAAPFAGDLVLLSDNKGTVVKKFTVKKEGTWGAIVPAVVSGNLERYMPFHPGEKELGEEVKDIADKPAQYPATFLVGEDGTILDLYRCTSFSDTMPFDRIEKFIPEGKRCKCNKKTCIAPTCRKNYEDIKKDAESMLHTG